MLQASYMVRLEQQEEIHNSERDACMNVSIILYYLHSGGAYGANYLKSVLQRQSLACVYN